MKRRSFLHFAAATALCGLILTSVTHAAPPARKILFFSKSSGFEHSVISYKKGQPSYAENILKELGEKNNWTFTFSKDGSLFSKGYLAQFDAVFFYTTGNLCEPGTDGQPAMSPEGKQALLEYVSAGKGFIGSHSATDTFHTNNEAKKGPERYKNFGPDADPYIQLIGGEFIKHGAQQSATMRVIEKKFPGFEKLGADFSMNEEWYSLKDFRPDIHVLLVQETETMKGIEYQRPAYPATWARKHGAGRVFYTSMGHREDVWTNPVFQDILVGGISWAVGNVEADVTPNLSAVAPGALTNPPFPPPAAPKPDAAAAPGAPAAPAAPAPKP